MNYMMGNDGLVSNIVKNDKNITSDWESSKKLS